MQGDRFYALLTGDRLLLFESEECADGYLDRNREEWENRPK